MPVKRIVLLSSTGLLVATLSVAQPAGPTPLAPETTALQGSALPRSLQGLAPAQGLPAPAPGVAVAVPTTLQVRPPYTTLVAPAPTAPGVNPFANLPTTVPPSAALSAADISAGGQEPGANPFQSTTASAPAGSTEPTGEAFSLVMGTAEAATAESSDDDEERALRYYAAERDLVRVGAEIRRLKARSPDWQPPTDLFASVSTIDEQPLWDLFAQGDYANVRARIAELEAKTPGWTPSVDLTEKLANMEARTLLRSQAERGDWSGVIATAGAGPSFLVCAQIDVLWTLGEALARTGDLARAYELYAYVLQNCDERTDREATFQKASTLLPPQGVEALLAFARPLPDGTIEFQSQRFDRLRAAMGAVAAAESTAPIASSDLQAFASFVGSSRRADDAALFGWYLYGGGQWQGAADWFQAASVLGSDAKYLEGYVLALRNLEEIEQAERIAFDNRALSPELLKIYIELVSERLTDVETLHTVGEASLARFQTVTEQARSPLGAQSLGWHHLDGGELDLAREWFQRSMDWKANREAVLGLAVVASRSDVAGELTSVKTKYVKAFPELADFEDTPQAVVRTASVAASPPPARAAPTSSSRPAASRGGASSGETALMREAQAKFDAGDFTGALSALDARQSRYGHNGGAEVLRGWTNLKLRRFRDARAIFKAEDQRRSTRDTRFGIGAVSMEQYTMWPH